MLTILILQGMNLTMSVIKFQFMKICMSTLKSFNYDHDLYIYRLLFAPTPVLIFIYHFDSCMGFPFYYIAFLQENVGETRFISITSWIVWPPHCLGAHVNNH